MKTPKVNFFRSFAILLVITSAAAFSCSKDDDSGSAKGNAKYTINGITIEAKDGECWLEDGYLELLISSKDENGTIRRLSIEGEDVNKTGTYKLSGSFNYISYSEENSSANGNYWTTNFKNGNGSYTITKITKTRLTGTFEFEAVSPNDDSVIEVKNGSFDFPIED